MPISPTSTLQKGLLMLSLVVALLFLCALGRRRLESSKARSGLIVEILANVSEGLDRLEVGLEDISKRASAAKARLRRLVATRRRQNLLACALLQRKSSNSKSSTTSTVASSNRR
ncbi:PREDICTED: uncharacterized protein LOC105361325 [Ceratosolen solmsi marchali]|uniref:Uncharacterized protein LOC105361325 n=1 Tax=Ceratosolen solmsi marchali TaxID=326594 RepID=A0AAJ7DUD7_9HYME|nr:PREDICTED: uncharacterized protein LOC105361325 [Ceratosolen solmsi marchali]